MYLHVLFLKHSMMSPHGGLVFNIQLCPLESWKYCVGGAKRHVKYPTKFCHSYKLKVIDERINGCVCDNSKFVQDSFNFRSHVNLAVQLFAYSIGSLASLLLTTRSKVVFPIWKLCKIHLTLLDYLLLTCTIVHLFDMHSWLACCWRKGQILCLQ